MRPFSAIVMPGFSVASQLLLYGLSVTYAVAAPDSALPNPLVPLPTAAAAAMPMGHLAKGTTVWVRLETPLRAGQCKAGAPVAFTVAKDVFGPDGARLLASGAMGVGHVTKSAGHHAFGRAGRLAFTCDAVFGGISSSLRIPVLLSVQPKVEDITIPPSVDPPPVDLHSPGPVPGDVLANTPLGIHGQISHSTSGSFTLESGPDATADAGETFEATVAADTALPILPAPPPVVPVLPIGAVKIDTGNLDTAIPSTDKDLTWTRSLVQKCLQDGYTVVKMADGSIVMTPAQGSMAAPITVVIKRG
jgi:hypothetical protein